ncbi:hypothetical protein [Cytobacillus sp. IB215665]|uniref:hypothetical protein n=1 Tax=Cytobacillus sp. IB215665 TaxID=3097357 RepID=UPI002A156363|nr:hypothetical protein [Cytobacillus sp. IB215665]MDX8366789.1 hypothetical protein [Cytobacillus sp. IB215665]
MNQAKSYEYIDRICVNCPGSLWGAKSICRIHNKSIGNITSCEQWDRQLILLNLMMREMTRK